MDVSSVQLNVQKVFKQERCRYSESILIVQFRSDKEIQLQIINRTSEQESSKLLNI